MCLHRQLNRPPWHNQRNKMSLGLAFWIGMFLWLLFGLWTNWPVNSGNAKPFGATILLFVLLALLGWAEFGAPLHK